MSVLVTTIKLFEMFNLMYICNTSPLELHFKKMSIQNKTMMWNASIHININFCRFIPAGDVFFAIIITLIKMFIIRSSRCMGTVSEQKKTTYIFSCTASYCLGRKNKYINYYKETWPRSSPCRIVLASSQWFCLCVTVGALYSVYTLQMKGRWKSNMNAWFLFMYSQNWNCAASLFPNRNNQILAGKSSCFLITLGSPQWRDLTKVISILCWSTSRQTCLGWESNLGCLRRKAL